MLLFALFKALGLEGIAGWGRGAFERGIWRPGSEPVMRPQSFQQMLRMNMRSL